MDYAGGRTLEDLIEYVQDTISGVGGGDTDSEGGDDTDSEGDSESDDDGKGGDKDEL